MRPRQDLTYELDTRSDGTAVYRLTGDLYGSAKGYEFQDAVRKGIAAGGRRVVLDLADVGRIDSTGVGILVAIMWSASHGGAELVLACLPAIVERVLGIAMLLPRIAHAPTVEEALTRFGSIRS